MSDDKKTKVLLFGLGAIGGFYAFILGRNENVSLSVVARSNFDSVKSQGLRIESQNHGDHKVNIENVYKTPSDAGQIFDFVVCTNKAINPEATPALFENVADDRTTFVIIQNGVGNELALRKTFPQSSIISCVTWVGATQVSPGLIKHTKSEDMQIGLFPNPSLDPSLEESHLDRFASLLSTGKTIFTVEDNIQIKRWEKVVWNVAWNPITTLTNVDTQNWLESSPEATPMTKRLMREVIDVAQRCNVPLGYELIDQLFAKILAMPGIYSSMHTDMKEERPLEVEVIVGHPMAKAREFGMDVPTLAAVYSMIIAVDRRLASKL